MEFIPSELDLFAPQPIQTSIIGETVIPHNPLTTLDKCTTIQFNIPNLNDKYLDLNQIFLKLQLQVVKSDGTEFQAKDEKQPVLINNMLHSIFKGVTVELNGQIVSNTQFYHYKSYFENLLNYQKARATSLMEIQGFYLDVAGEMDNLEGSRQSRTVNSRARDLYGKLLPDVFNLNKLLINGVDVKISLELEKNEFCFMNTKTENTPRLKINEATLFTRYLTINPSILLAHHKILSTKNINYNFKRNVIKNFIIPSGINTQNIENVFNGQLPTNVLIAFVNNAAFNGDYKENPFNFKLFDLEQIQLNVNGNNLPSHPLTLNASKGLVAQAYHDLYQGLNYQLKDFGLMINESDFCTGFGIFAFDLTPTKRQGIINLTDEGIMKIGVKFSKSLEKPIVMIVYAEFNATFEVTKNKNIITNY